MSTLAAILPSISGPRVESAWLELLDEHGNPVGPIDGVLSWQVEQDANADIRGGLSAVIEERGQGIDWMRARFRPWKRVNGVTWSLGVYVPAPDSPLERHRSGGMGWDLTALDRTSILSGQGIGETYAVAPGDVITEKVSALIAATGEGNVSITPSALTARSLMVWHPSSETTVLRIVNDLLLSIGYSALYADGTGQLRGEPYRAPGERAVAMDFVAGETAQHSPDWDRSTTATGVPNRAIGSTPDGMDAPALTATITNEDPTSPYSYQARGNRWIDRTYSNVEAQDQATLEAILARYLSEASRPSASLEIQYRALPLPVHSLVRFAPSNGEPRLATVQKWSLSSEPGALTSATLREV